MSQPSRTWQGADRLGGLRRFAIAISVLNVLGHTVLGFEQAWAHPLAALAAAYATELLLEGVDARLAGRRARYRGDLRALTDFLLSAHISGLAVAMLLYANERIWPVVFAAVAAIASKSLFRVDVDGGSRHVMNPSNFGITLTLILFPWVGIAPPYHFTENLDTIGDWLLPALIVASGTFLNARFTHRLPLVAAWLLGFGAQAAVRTAAAGVPLSEGLVPALLPLTGLAFVLYTFYMITDPATTPHGVRGQVVFGVAVAATYGALMSLHIVFGLFFALTIVSAARGGALKVHAWVRLRQRAATQVPATTALAERG